MIETKNKRHAKRASLRKRPAKKETLADLVAWVESLPISRSTKKKKSPLNIDGIYTGVSTSEIVKTIRDQRRG